MSGPCASLWLAPLPDLPGRLERCLADAGSSGRVFFRADDVAVPDPRLMRLLELFRQRRTPLNLAVVPAWLTAVRWRRLREIAGGDPALWCWHQHGWRHVNHEPAGKKQEFGPSRQPGAIRADLEAGRRRLEALMGDAFLPVFTPPWNRCDGATLRALRELGYRAVSRFARSTPAPPAGLPDLAASVDLHTRKETDPALGWENLFAELGAALSQPLCGIMIHHGRMNAAAFAFLELLIEALARRRGAVGNFTDLLDMAREEV